jgi:hypothetical protein
MDGSEKVIGMSMSPVGAFEPESSAPVAAKCQEGPKAAGEIDGAEQDEHRFGESGQHQKVDTEGHDRKRSLGSHVAPFLLLHAPVERRMHCCSGMKKA